MDIAKPSEGMEGNELNDIYFSQKKPIKDIPEGMLLDNETDKQSSMVAIEFLNDSTDLNLKQQIQYDPNLDRRASEFLQTYESAGPDQLLIKMSYGSATEYTQTIFQIMGQTIVNDLDQYLIQEETIE